MRVKTIFLLVVGILIAVLILQNDQVSRFNILFFSGVYITKLSVLLVVALASFAAGVVIAQPRKYRIDTSQQDEDNEEDHPKRKTDTLSDEDRDYIN